ncbi:MAG: hypothetical protein GYB50_22275 [Rhodobacteraceae bacterium]|uniref:hypothetical protein n=1 Tax=Salipiger thiooxidans TaxID=282683 RepID=UPI001A8E7413|nr:hypothetical protein [Salipiger thiooxidans]MBN8185715.1 hypothetical protein [Salipiger thiooxidans]MBR9840591.1 hypothetical protein [Paracoccaceae bacterium]
MTHDAQIQIQPLDRALSSIERLLNGVGVVFNTVDAIAALEELIETCAADIGHGAGVLFA